MSNRIVPFTETEEVAHLMEGVKNGCTVCGSSSLGKWTDYNGQVRCCICGTTHQILGSHHTEEFLTKHGLKKEDVSQTYCDCFVFVPMLQAYFKETNRKVPFGSYFLTQGIPAQDFRDFYEWLADNHERFRPEWDEHFDWDGLMEQYGKLKPAGVG